VLGPYYMRDDTPIGKALWATYNACKFSEADPEGSPGVEWMKGIPEAKKGLEAAA